MRTLTTERLCLEPLTEGHAAEMFRVLGDPVIYTFLQERPPFTEDEVRARYRYLERRISPDGDQQWLNWVVRERDGGETVGYVQTTVYASGAADIAYVLTPSRWGRGYAKEACLAMLGELAVFYKVKTFMATVAPRNGASMGVLRSLGFKQVSPQAGMSRAADAGDLIFLLEPP